MMMSRPPIRVCLVLAALILCPFGAVAGDPPAPAGPPDQAAVDAAVERGVAWLKKAQQGDGSWDRDLGKTSLALYALTHAGVPADDRAVKAAYRWVLGSLGRPDNYGASLALMALATMDPVGNARRIGRLARLIEMSQCRNGQWTYKLKGGRSGGDNSNTQFAVLALWYADRLGVKIKAEVFQKCLDYFLSTQNEDGGWGYSAKERSKSYGSMVATGLTTLVICRSGLTGELLASDKSRTGAGVVKAVAWLGEHLSVKKNPKASFKFGGRFGGTRKEVTESFWRFYWLWSLERASTLAGVDSYGERDWYAEGATELLAIQRDDGHWVGAETPMLATSFAILFLSRSTRRVVATEKPKFAKPVTPTPK